MRKIAALLAAVALLGLMVPSVSAGHPHSTSGSYTLAFGAGSDATGLIFGLIICTGPPEEEICEDLGIAPIGGAAAEAEDGHLYAAADVTGQDATNTPLPFTACFTEPEAMSCIGESTGDPSCSNEASAIRDTTGYTKVAIFVMTAWVEGTTVCFGTTGEVDVSWT